MFHTINVLIYETGYFNDVTLYYLKKISLHLFECLSLHYKEPLILCILYI